MSRVFAARIELGQVQESDALDEMFRQIQKKHNEEILIGHPDLHRVLKELVKLDAETKDTKLDFTSQLASVMLKNLGSTLPLATGGKVAVIGPNANLSEAIAGYYGGKAVCPGQGGASPFANGE